MDADVQPMDPASGQPRTLTGVGVGPGDPELLTLKAVRVLNDADVILVPRTERSGPTAGRAQDVIRAACPDVADRIHGVRFAMREPGEEPGDCESDAAGASAAGVPAVVPAQQPTRLAARDAAAADALRWYDEGARHVVLATIGDPSVYSTFSYVAARVARACPDVQIDVVPGITAMQAMAAASGQALCEGDETLTLVPATASSGQLDAALAGAATVVIYKSGRHLPQVRALIEQRGRLLGTRLGTDLGLSDQQVRFLADIDPASPTPYFSTLLCPAPGREPLGADDVDGVVGVVGVGGVDAVDDTVAVQGPQR